MATNTELTQRARQLRHDMTDAERKLWNGLRRRQIEGCRFQRQRPIGDFIVDFVCYEPKVIVEVDGGQHVEQREYDEMRTRFLSQQGFRVLRFWNDQALRETDTVLQVIADALSEECVSTPS